MEELYGLFRVLELYVALHAQAERQCTVEKLKESLEAKNPLGSYPP
jgi:hypothetical protein